MAQFTNESLRVATTQALRAFSQDNAQQMDHVFAWYSGEFHALLKREATTFPRYVLRYTFDCKPIRESESLAELIDAGKRSDYMVHIVDTVPSKHTVVWQNAASERYGSVGLA